METSPGLNLGNVTDLPPPGDMKAVKTGDREILLVHLDTGIFALDNFCSHNGCRLIYGTLHGGQLRCPCHSSVFDVTTGRVINGPATTPLPSYRVILREGGITLAP